MTRAATAEATSPHRVHAFDTMAKARDAEAKALLHRIAAHVHPIMRKRRWRVERLSEFFPSDAGLLGMNRNHGEQVLIRLRPAHDEAVFLPFESLLGTMLHELAHLGKGIPEIGPHNAAFYKLLDELQDECEVNMANGIVDGDALGVFLGSGVAVGGGRKPASVQSAGSLAAAAAEARQKRAMLGLSGGQRLGGHSRSGRTTMTPSQMAAEAAERRRLDAISCGTMDSTVEGINPYRRRRTGGGNDSDDNDDDGSAKRPALAEPTAPRPLARPPASSHQPQSPQQLQWACVTCTYLNEPLHLQCAMCGSVRLCT